MNERKIRKLARKDTNQVIYTRAKELHLKLFANDYDLSRVQISYLYWLEIYNSLYTDLAMGEDYIDEDVIKDDLRTEAYLLLRSKMRKDKKFKEDIEKQENKSDAGIPTVMFKRK